MRSRGCDGPVISMTVTFLIHRENIKAASCRSFLWKERRGNAALEFAFLMPVFLVLGLCTGAMYMASGQPLVGAAQLVINELNSPTLMALPLFVMAAAFMRGEYIERGAANAWGTWAKTALAGPVTATSEAVRPRPARSAGLPSSSRRVRQNPCAVDAARSARNTSRRPCPCSSRQRSK